VSGLACSPWGRTAQLATLTPRCNPDRCRESEVDARWRAPPPQLAEHAVHSDQPVQLLGTGQHSLLQTATSVAVKPAVAAEQAEPASGWLHSGTGRVGSGARHWRATCCTPPAQLVEQGVSGAQADQAWCAQQAWSWHPPAQQTQLASVASQQQVVPASQAKPSVPQVVVGDAVVVVVAHALRSRAKASARWALNGSRSSALISPSQRPPGPMRVCVRERGGDG
jgi:hypothetical protein